jgi:hypothetical protein
MGIISLPHPNAACSIAIKAKINLNNSNTNLAKFNNTRALPSSPRHTLHHKKAT